MTSTSVRHGESEDEPGELRSFGRRRGRKPSARQAMLLREVLPRVAVTLDSKAPLSALFSDAIEGCWLEIGFGGGEHLLWQAAQHPHVGLIGCEPFQDGVVKVLDAIERGAAPNVRLHADDARDLVRRLPAGSIARAFILFPDPWPKRRHVKRRLVNAQMLAQLARVIRLGGVLRLGTDIGDYARTMLLAIQEEGSFHWTASGPQDWRIRPADWPETRYEGKAVAAGRCCYYLTFTRRGA
jgi:tRNA (guanine-N7-)-methyltransferase